MSPLKTAVTKIHEKLVEATCDYTELFLNRWNAECACCWAGFIAVVHLVTGFVLGKLL